MGETSKIPIKGRVAQILNERELVITVGVAAGVAQGMKFAILSEQPLEIRDPVTEEVLDVIDREKVRVEAVHVRDRITICRTYRMRSSGNYSLSLLKELQPYREAPETLRADDASLPPPLSPEESFVKVNDRVVQVDDKP